MGRAAAWVTIDRVILRCGEAAETHTHQIKRVRLPAGTKRGGMLPLRCPGSVGPSWGATRRPMQGSNANHLAARI